MSVRLVLACLLCSYLVAADNWQGIGGGANDWVRRIVHDETGGQLYVAGDFDSVGVTASAHAAVWSGTAWTALPIGLTASPEALVRSAAGGIFIAGGATDSVGSYRVYRLSGTTWVAHGNGYFNGPIRALAVDGTTVYAAGSFTAVSGIPAANIAVCTSGAADWGALSGGGLNDEVHALAVAPGGGSIVVAGAFTLAGGATANRVAIWSGTAWSAVGGGAGGRVRAVSWRGTVVAPVIHIAGDFTTVDGGTAASGVARYATGTWAAVGSRGTGTAYAMHVRADNAIVVGHGSGIDLWNGTSWTLYTVGGLVSDVWSDADGDIYIGGAFTTNGNMPFQRLARWDASPPSVSITATDDTAHEGGGTGTLALTLSGSEPADVLIRLTQTGTALSSDYSASPTITIAAGSTTGSITITATDDTIAESDESLIATIDATGAGYTVGAPATATIWLIDNDTGSQPEVSVSVLVASAGEGAANGSIRLTLSAPAAAPLTVNYTLSGTATNTTDYATLSGTANFGTGASAVTLSVQPVNDILSEGAETVVVTAAPGTGYTLGNPTYGVVVIADDETAGVTPAVSIATTDTTATEGSSDPGVVRFTVSPAQAAPLLVYFTRGGTATQGTDYSTIGTAVTIPAGNATYDLTVAPVDDALTESTETVTITLVADAAYTIGSGGPCTIDIIDDESTTPVVTIVASDPDATEGGDTATFTISIAPAPTSTIYIGRTISGGATAGVDYTDDTNLTILAGQTSRVVTFTALTDAVTEGDEYITWSILPGTGYVRGTPLGATITIHNTVPPPPGGGGGGGSSSGGGGGGGCGAGAVALLLALLTIGWRQRRPATT